jgi:FMN phosphatase YigB (HAD superfamily)
MIQVVFFDLHGTLVDSQRLRGCYAHALGRTMSARYGGEARLWAEANRRILEDWDSYHADLNFSGDDGMHDYWEGAFRTTRALFRLTNTPEPDDDALWALARELPLRATENCDALYPDARPALAALHAAGLMLAVATHAQLNHAEGVLRGGGVRGLFSGPLCTPDVIGQFDKDAAFYRAALARAGVEPAACLAVDDHARPMSGARAAGMKTVLISRQVHMRFSHNAATYLIRDLRELPGLLKRV